MGEIAGSTSTGTQHGGGLQDNDLPAAFRLHRGLGTAAACSEHRRSRAASPHQSAGGERGGQVF